MSSTQDYYDDLETRDPEQRERELFEHLVVQLHNARERSAVFGRLLADTDPASVTSRAALARLPVTRKSELVEMQRKTPPFGGVNATPVRELGRVFASPGPIYEPEARRNDYWRTARALYAAGFRRGELVHNTFSYHLTPGAWMLDAGASDLGCPVIPAGVGQTELQVQTIATLKPRGYVGTPSFLKILIDKADELGVEIDSLCKALVSGEALPPSLREEINARGIKTYQCYATADLGLIAYESPALEGMIVDEEIIVEIVQLGTGDPVAEGEVGEVVVTTMNPDYPLIRFGTGDLSAVLPGPSPCGRTNTRIKGWLGRADQATKVKGMFVHPAQVAAVAARHPEIRKARLVVDREGVKDVMTLHCEVEGVVDADRREAIAASVRELCKVKGGVKIVAPGTLAADDKVIDDVRKYE